jgi:Bacterial archaeo-eukaryotic release factor family 10
VNRGVGTDSPVGLLLVSGDGATIAEWHPRRVEVLRKLELGLTEAEEHERAGGSYSHPTAAADKGRAALSGSQRDLWERRLEDHRSRFARGAAETTARTAESHGWDLVLVLGDPRRTGPAVEELERHGIDAVRSDLVLDWLRPAALAERLAPEVARGRASLQPARGRR